LSKQPKQRRDYGQPQRVKEAITNHVPVIIRLCGAPSRCAGPHNPVSLTMPIDLL
jgi:hypothetical protein